MMKDYVIRRATPADRAAIVAFQRAAIAHVPADAYPISLLQAWWREPEAGLDDMIAAGRYWVAAYRGALVGGAGWQPADEVAGADGGATTAVIRGVFVDPAHHTRGLGTRMVRLVEDTAVTAGCEHILVPAPQCAAGFYARLGYAERDDRALPLETGQVISCRTMWKHAG